MTNTACKVAAGWAAGYGTLALGWTITGRGFPFGTNDHHNGISNALRELDPGTGAPIFAAVLLATAVALLIAAGNPAPARPGRLAILGLLWPVAAALLIVVPDARLLALAGYAPMLIAGLPFGWPPVDYSAIFTWNLGNQLVAVIGGVLVARAALTWQRRSAGACERCGRRATGGGGWTEPERAARWGRVAVGVAATVPALYAVSRLSWAAGIPLGIDDAFLEQMRAEGILVAAAGLGSFALVGAVLTLGLAQRWGERFPRWMIGLAGRPVPIRLATVPATVVAILVAAASVSLFTAPGAGNLFTGASAPGLLWPLWSVALGAAAYAYHLRRRPACGRCGRPAEAGRESRREGLVPQPGAGAY
ncbi:hypothetical protein AB0F81_17185 [Actinoplanes sp. NPDC024001]|uniref:hypothetical protein n=1 Tax=Actinoplanes sp. NPDC024001 TaxID=3154598 RepID=UPI0033D6267F